MIFPPLPFLPILPSPGRAAELAGMPRVEFLLSLERYKVCPFEAELADLESGRG